MNYKDVNDYELIYHIKENDEIAYNTMFDKYSFIVNKLAYDYYCKNKNIGIEYEDLCQEGFYAVSMAIKDYDQDNSLFYTYVLICIKREMERLVKAGRRNKQMILNNAISINSAIDLDDSLFLEDVIAADTDVESFVISEELFKELFLYKHELSFEESLIYELKVNRFSNKEISLLLDISYKKVDNSLRKIRQMLLKYNLTL